MIVVCGEALMDVFDAGATPTGQALDARCGGSPFNVAIGLARLGRPTALCAGVSTGFLGERLARALADDGVDTSLAERIDAPTTVCVVSLDAAGVPRYDFLGERGADRRLGRGVLDRLPPVARLDALHVGSYAMVVGETAATQRAIVERLHRDVPVAWDPNVRTLVEPRREVWLDTLAWMLPRTAILKVSREDLDWLFPGASPDALAFEWLAAGVKLVVVTDGARGAAGWLPRAKVEARAPAVDVVDTVGAGDTFQAATLTWLAEAGRLSHDGLAALDAAALSRLLDFASRAAAITCSRRGADLPRRAEVD